jgi:hypothetical protein
MYHLPFQVSDSWALIPVSSHDDGIKPLPPDQGKQLQKYFLNKIRARKRTGGG